VNILFLGCYFLIEKIKKARYKTSYPEKEYYNIKKMYDVPRTGVTIYVRCVGTYTMVQVTEVVYRLVFQRKFD